MAETPTHILKKQPINRRVVLALLPCLAGGIYFFGWRSLAMALVSCLTAFAVEYLFCRSRKEPVSEAVFVTALIYVLILPPGVPWHVLVIGAVFAVFVTKEIFGGYGKNICNPAMSGRCFVYICFPLALTAQWSPVAKGSFGALDRWDTVTKTDTMTSATPLAIAKNEGILPDKTDLFLGRVTGTMGVNCIPLVLLGGIYLFVTRTANRTIILSILITYALLNAILTWAGVKGFYGPLYALLNGSFWFGAFFMATDPVSAPRTRPAQLLYGILIASATVLIRNFSIFNGGLMFSGLLGNMFAPILDVAVKHFQQRQKAVTQTEGNTA